MTATTNVDSFKSTFSYCQILLIGLRSINNMHLCFWVMTFCQTLYYLFNHSSFVVSVSKGARPLRPYQLACFSGWGSTSPPLVYSSVTYTFFYVLPKRFEFIMMRTLPRTRMTRRELRLTLKNWRSTLTTLTKTTRKRFLITMNATELQM